MPSCYETVTITVRRKGKTDTVKSEWSGRGYQFYGYGEKGTATTNGDRRSRQIARRHFAVKDTYGWTSQGDDYREVTIQTPEKKLHVSYRHHWM